MAAEFLYPPHGNFSNVNNGRMISAADILYVQYRSSWSSVNLTLICQAAVVSPPRPYFNVPDNPILASGTYKFGSIQDVTTHNANFKINQYPTQCNFKVTRYGDNDNALSGEFFWVTDDSTSPTTYQPTSTPTPSASGSQTTGSANTSSSTSTPAASSANNDSSLSTGAKAGIAVGTAAAVLIIVGLIFYIWRMRRQMNNQYNSYGTHELSGQGLPVEAGAGTRAGTKTNMELYTPDPHHELQA